MNKNIFKTRLKQSIFTYTCMHVYAREYGNRPTHISRYTLHELTATGLFFGCVCWVSGTTSISDSHGLSLCCARILLLLVLLRGLEPLFFLYLADCWEGGWLSLVPWTDLRTELLD